MSVNCEWCGEAHPGAGLRSECINCTSCKGKAHPHPGNQPGNHDKCYDCAEGDCHVTIEKKLHRTYNDVHPNEIAGAGMICPKGHLHAGTGANWKNTHSALFRGAKVTTGEDDLTETDEHLMNHGWARVRAQGNRGDLIESHHHDMGPKVKEAATRFADFHPHLAYDCWGRDKHHDDDTPNLHSDNGRGMSADNARNHWGLAKSLPSQTIFKGYKLTFEGTSRALDAVHGHAVPMDDPHQWARDTLSSIPDGKPGLSIHRNTTTYGRRDNTYNSARYEPQSGRHMAVYRDHNGQAVTAAAFSSHNAYGVSTPGIRKVHYMVSDKTRGMLHGRGVFHVARALKRIGATQASELTVHSQRMIAHGLDLKPDSRVARKIAKGYEATSEKRQGALDHVGGHPIDLGDADDWARQHLQEIPHGKPGLSIHRHTDPEPWALRPRLTHLKDNHTIVYRDPKGVPVTAATTHVVRERGPHSWSPKPGHYVSKMMSDRSRGFLHGRGVFHVTRALHRMGATKSQDLSEHSQKLIAHALDAQGKGTRAARAAK